MTHTIPSGMATTPKDGDCLDITGAILDALPEQIAVLSADGTIVAVNAAWRRNGEARQRPGVAARDDIGLNYLDICADAHGIEAAGAVDVGAGISAVLGGRLPEFQMDYAGNWSDLTNRGRWFSMTVTPLSDGWRGALVVRSDITSRRHDDARLRVAATAFESSQGMMVTDEHGLIMQINQAFTQITGYEAQEVVGKSPSLLSSGRHGAAFYRAMWSAIATVGSWEGEIWNRRKNGEIYPEHLTISAVRDELGAVTNYVAALNDITISKAANDEIRSLAFYDPLTRLPNRRLLLERLRQVLAASVMHHRYGALVFIDLDDFKTLNDTLGHKVGDQLLQQVASRLQGCLRQGDTVARLGGDEFVVLLEGMSSDALEAAAQTEALGNKILAELNHPYMLGSHQCHSTPSMGATLFHHGHPPQPDELLMQADIAMYQAKQAGRNGMRFFDQHMQDSINERARMETALREAIELRQFVLHYQVQVDQYGKVRGAEALIRWVRPDGSMVPPASFIPLAEETGLILQIGHWVLETACAQLRIWQAHPAMRQMILAINVSAPQFHQAGFHDEVEAVVCHYGVDPALLKLELTEGILLENIEETIASMRQLRELGVSFSLDDFGTGYSSLQYLKRLPLDQLKIDQSFVRDLVDDSSDQAIVRTIIAMAGSLGLDVIAEGVETEAQRALLQQLGCLSYQGYLYSQPLPEERLLDWLAAH